MTPGFQSHFRRAFAFLVIFSCFFSFLTEAWISVSHEAQHVAAQVSALSAPSVEACADSIEATETACSLCFLAKTSVLAHVLERAGATALHLETAPLAVTAPLHSAPLTGTLGARAPPRT